MPAGWLVVGRCRNCGGRRERLAELDGTDGIDAGRAGASDRLQAQAAAGSSDSDPLVGAVEYVFAFLQEAHGECEYAPAIHRLAPLTDRFLRKALDYAGRVVGGGEGLAGMLYLLVDDGRACVVETGHLIRGAAGPSAERTANRAAGVGAVRKYLKSLSLRPVAAVIAAEAWASTLDDYIKGGHVPSGRDEVFVASCTTRRFGTVGWTPIDRTVGTSDRSRALFDRLEWRPIREPAALVDGLLADPVERVPGAPG